MIVQYDRVVLAVDLPERGLRAGDIGVAVEVYTNPTTGYEIEFMTLTGATVALVTLNADQVRAPTPVELPHVRAFAKP